MTREEAEAWCRDTGSRVPDLGAPREGQARITLDMGERYGHARLTLTCDGDWSSRWADWMARRMESMGGRVDVRD